MARIPHCGDGNETRNAWWHFGFAVLALGSLVFHAASVYIHVQRAKKK